MFTSGQWLIAERRALQAAGVLPGDPPGLAALLAVLNTELDSLEWIVPPYGWLGY